MSFNYLIGESAHYLKAGGDAIVTDASEAYWIGKSIHSAVGYYKKMGYKVLEGED